MSVGELKYPQWQAPLQELVLEVDREKLREKLEKAETAILQRLQELRAEPNGQSEREAINDALSTLRGVQQGRLGFP